MISRMIFSSSDYEYEESKRYERPLKRKPAKAQSTVDSNHSWKTTGAKLVIRGCSYKGMRAFLQIMGKS